MEPSRDQPLSSTSSAYAVMHQQDWIPGYYDGVMYGPGSYDVYMWQLQQPLLREVAESIARRFKRPRYLDFACGTGRVLVFIAPHVHSATAVDISGQMAAAAAAKVPTANCETADILTDTDLQAKRFDLITAFRFFTNTEPEMRSAVMARLAAMLASSDARLVFNVHSHTPSAQTLNAWYRRLHGWAPLSGMSTSEIMRLVDGAGLEVVTWRGYGLLPPRLYHSRFAAAARRLDGAFARIPLTRYISRDAVFVCRKRNS